MVALVGNIRRRERAASCQRTARNARRAAHSLGVTLLAASVAMGQEHNSLPQGLFVPRQLSGDGATDAAAMTPPKAFTISSSSSLSGSRHLESAETQEKVMEDGLEEKEEAELLENEIEAPDDEDTPVSPEEICQEAFSSEEGLSYTDVAVVPLETCNQQFATWEQECQAIESKGESYNLWLSSGRESEGQSKRQLHGCSRCDANEAGVTHIFPPAGRYNITIAINGTQEPLTTSIVSAEKKIAKDRSEILYYFDGAVVGPSSPAFCCKATQHVKNDSSQAPVPGGNEPPKARCEDDVRKLGEGSGSTYKSYPISLDYVEAAFERCMTACKSEKDALVGGGCGNAVQECYTLRERELVPGITDEDNYVAELTCRRQGNAYAVAMGGELMYTLSDTAESEMPKEGQNMWACYFDNPAIKEKPPRNESLVKFSNKERGETVKDPIPRPVMNSSDPKPSEDGPKVDNSTTTSDDANQGKAPSLENSFAAASQPLGAITLFLLTALSVINALCL